ncbi:MAG TPA: hypothetical protein VHX62_15835 [Solirubrobacteraceae bacterium]|jgi:hypothetical protein|nr:hypothetical protein [Solirubrobacteraceae bacterium]
MTTLPTDRREEDWEEQRDDGTADEPLPRRPRRQFFNRRSAALGAVLTCAIGFYAGIRVEKGQLSNSSTGLAALGTGGTTGGAAAARTGRGTGAGARSGAASLFGSGARSSASGATGAAGFAGAGALAGGAGGSASFGTVAGVDGKTIDVTESSGNTVKVKLSSATKITKTQSARRSAIRPGDTVVISGVTGSGGTVSAASVTDSGNRTPGSSTTSGSSGTGGSSAIGSLFSGGGGG